MLDCSYGGWSKQIYENRRNLQTKDSWVRLVVALGNVKKS